MPYLGKSPSQGVRTRFQFTPNAGTTNISGADANGITLTFTDGNYVDVYLNGAMLKAVCVEAGMIALRRGATELQHEDFMEGVSVVQAKKKQTLQYYA